jgi:hypothetical protein
VASINSEDPVTAFTGMIRNLMKLVLFSVKAIEENPWADFG